ncbi:hypothetical protein [Deinococcus maricopensis]|uniref:hypothetical protein n=1 Tax=Deinococcus maricopensis TaxID=309887 RepID=UPI0011D2184F|nr:hypothetical protein [Deinococcus maricopensis]
MLNRLLDILEQHPQLTPTSWDYDDNPARKLKYQRADFLDKVYAHPDQRVLLPELRRDKPIGYEAYFTNSPRGGNKFSLYATPQDQAALHLLYEVAALITRELKPHCSGILHDNGGNDAAAVLDMKYGEFRQFGPDGLALWTWFGPALRHLLDLRILDDAGAELMEEDWGGVRVMLTPSPWNLDAKEALTRQQDVLKALQGLNIFGDYSRYPVRMHAASGWAELP